MSDPDLQHVIRDFHVKLANLHQAAELYNNEPAKQKEFQSKIRGYEKALEIPTKKQTR